MALRLISCVGRFERCYPEGEAGQMYSELCTIAAHQQGLLSVLGGKQEPICDALFSRGEADSMLRSIAEPLQALVQLAAPDMAPTALGNLGTRFNYEEFFEASARVFLQPTSERRQRTPALSYPALFSPQGNCGTAKGPELTHVRVGAAEVTEALEQLTRAGIGLSRFVVNFGAADGVCGARDDWNADPANCLASAGSAALLIEGAPGFRADLRRRFGDRANVTLVTEFLPLGNVSSLLHDQLRRLPAASPSPDLLKVDVDHADCAFMSEALRVMQPKLMHLEIAPQVPPPLDYEQVYQPRMLDVGLGERAFRQDLQGSEDASGGELTGCSLTAFLRRAPGYELLAVGAEDALLVRRDLRGVLLDDGRGGVAALEPGTAWREGCLCSAIRNHAASTRGWGFDFRLLADERLTAAERLHYLLQVLRERRATAFTLQLSPTFIS